MTLPRPPTPLPRQTRRVAWALVAGATLALAACGSPAPAPEVASNCGLDAQRRARAEALLDQLVQRGHAPGAVLDIRCHGRPWLVRAAGQRSAEAGAALRVDDLFRIYSMTKPLTALAVMLLVEDGRVRLDDPVARHLPAFADVRVHAEEKDGRWITTPPVRALSVRDLLRHTAGMPYLAPVAHPVYRRYVERGIDNGSGLPIRPTDGSAVPTSAGELASRIAAIPLLAQPGERFVYGNASEVAGALVEAVTGAPLGQLLEQRVFAPLSMKDTLWVVPEAHAGRLTTAYTAPSQRPAAGGDALAARARTGDLGRSTFTAADPTTAPGASSVYRRARPIQYGGAGLVSTAADYQRFMTLMLDGGLWQGRRLLRAETVAEMTKNQLSPQALAAGSFDQRGLGYGLGFGVVVEAGKAPGAAPPGTFFWSGAASTYFWIDPQRRIGGVLMTQVFGGDVAPYFTELLELLYR